jgi:hypothetical protein
MARLAGQTAKREHYQMDPQKEKFFRFCADRLNQADFNKAWDLWDQTYGRDTMATAPNAGMPQGKLATDPPVSERQRKAMFAAREGRSTLGIPKSVGEEFVGARDRKEWGSEVMALDQSPAALDFYKRFPEATRIREAW